MSVPRGGKFIPAPMHYFMRFNGADGMHAGYCPAIPRRMGVSGCRNSMQLRSSTPSAKALQLRFLEEPLRDAIWDNHNPHLCAAAIDSQTSLSRQF